MRVKQLLGSVAVLVSMLLATVQAEAYVDPGTTGLVSQLFYILFYGALAVFLYWFRYFKQFVTDVRKNLTKLFTSKAKQ